MPRGRPFNTIRKVEVRFYLPKAMHDELYLMLLDSFSNRPRYGAMSKVGEHLFAQFITDVKENGLPRYLSEK